MSPNSDFLYPSHSMLSSNSMMQSSTDTAAEQVVSSSSASSTHADINNNHTDDVSSTTSPASAMDWPLAAKTPKFSTHRGHSLKETAEKENNHQERSSTRLKDVFSCAKPNGRYSSSPPPPAPDSGGEEEEYGGGVAGIADDLQIKNNMEVFLDGLVNGFWQCPGGGGMAATGGDASVHSNISRTSAASCKQVMDSLTQSTQQMEFQFIPLATARKQQQQQQESPNEIPPIPSSSSKHTTTPQTHQHTTQPSQPKRAIGKMFKRIRVKRGENIGLELFEHAKSVYISRVAKEGTGLKRGMRIIAINDHPCPDSVGEAIQVLSIRNYADADEGGYVTFVTGEQHDFEQAASVVVEEKSSDNDGTGTGDGDTMSDTYSIRSSMGYV